MTTYMMDYGLITPGTSAKCAGNCQYLAIQVPTHSEVRGEKSAAMSSLTTGLCVCV